MQDSILAEKALIFGGRILKLYKYLISKKDYIISKQIVRSGTSIGANIYEARFAQSKADFVSKMHIALKEASETEYWINLLIVSDTLTEEMANSILTDCVELKRMLISTINTSKNRSY